MFDLHTHHERCGHAIGSLENYIESAISKGLRVLGITDHSPYFFSDVDRPYPKLAMAKSEFAKYVEEILLLKKKYEDRIELLVGIESDVFKEYADLYGEIYARYPLDYVIGSIHFTSPFAIMRGLNWKTASDEERRSEIERFAELLQLSVRCGWVDIIGHMDRFNRGYASFRQAFAPYLDSTLKLLAENGVAMEVNTGGFRKGSEDYYPSMEVVERAHYYGVGITFGSDAHHPDRVGDEWEKAREMLKAIGCKRWVVFKQRKPVYLDI